MKPTLPEDREMDDTAAQVSEHYRAGAQEEPPAKLDAAIRAVAHREVAKPRPGRNWPMPASIAAMLVIGVSLFLIVRDHEPPLPSFDHPAEEAKLAKSAPSQLALKAQPKAKADFHREDRPSRERTARPDREPAVKNEVAESRDSAISGSSTKSVSPTPAAPAAAASESPVEQEKSAIAEADKVAAGKKTEGSSDVATASRGTVQAIRKQERAGALPLQPDDWLAKIDHLLRDGKEGQARDQLLSFHKQFPQYPVPERMKAYLPPER